MNRKQDYKEWLTFLMEHGI